MSQKYDYGNEIVHSMQNLPNNYNYLASIIVNHSSW